MRRTLWPTISHEVKVEGIREGTFFLGGGGEGWGLRGEGRR